jgi:hypothetical protein
MVAATEVCTVAPGWAAWKKVVSVLTGAGGGVAASASAVTATVAAPFSFT